LGGVPGGVLDTGRQDAAAGVQQVHAEQVAGDERGQEHQSIRDPFGSPSAAAREWPQKTLR